MWPVYCGLPRQLYHETVLTGGRSIFQLRQLDAGTEEVNRASEGSLSRVTVHHVWHAFCLHMLEGKKVKKGVLFACLFRFSVTSCVSHRCSPLTCQNFLPFGKLKI